AARGARARAPGTDPRAADRAVRRDRPRAPTNGDVLPCRKPRDPRHSRRGRIHSGPGARGAWGVRLGPLIGVGMPNPVDVVEALLFASDAPLEAERIRDV